MKWPSAFFYALLSTQGKIKQIDIKKSVFKTSLNLQLFFTYINLFHLLRQGCENVQD